MADHWIGPELVGLAVLLFFVGWLISRWANRYIRRHVSRALQPPFVQASHCTVREEAS